MDFVKDIKNSKPDPLNPTTVKDWFLYHYFSVAEDPKDPTSLLFLLKSVANVLNDKKYKSYKSNETKIIKIKGVEHVMLTERGLYEYLLSAGDNQFCNFVLDLLVSIRKMTVSKAEYTKYVYQNNIYPLQKKDGFSHLSEFDKVVNYFSALRLNIRYFDPKFLARINRMIINKVDHEKINEMIRNYH